MKQEEEGLVEYIMEELKGVDITDPDFLKYLQWWSRIKYRRGRISKSVFPPQVVINPLYNLLLGANLAFRTLPSTVINACNCCGKVNTTNIISSTILYPVLLQLINHDKPVVSHDHAVSLAQRASSCFRNCYAALYGRLTTLFPCKQKFTLR